MKSTIKLLTHFFPVFLFLLALGCHNKKSNSIEDSSKYIVKINTNEFETLLTIVSDGWNTRDARSAADCFSTDAVYMEPPDQQLYEGRNELYEFFGGAGGRTDPMKMTWHHLIFDEEKQIGTGEYTFAYKGRLSHGIVIVQIHDGKIEFWREYQYRSKIQWDEFVGKSKF